MLKYSYRIGAIFYGIWGLLHIPIGYAVFTGGLNLEPGIIQGRIFQVGFFLGIAGIAALTIARWNWSNHPAAYWSNLWLTTIVDIGFLLFIQFPGYVPLTRGLPGPITWIIALIFSTIGYLQARHFAAEKRTLQE
jgi:hypothetical protein